jgi:raffinose/stachyose/melibiose transport system permease protein
MSVRPYGLPTSVVVRRLLRPSRIIVFLLALVWLVISFYPILYVVFTSLRTQAGFLLGTPWLPPSTPTLENFWSVLQNGFLQYFLNSVIVAVASVALIIVCATPAAYVIVRSRLRAARWMFQLFLIGLAIPVQAAIIPIFVLVAHMGLYNTLAGMIFPFVAFGLPFTLLILVNFIRDIPRELFDSMRIDGVGEIQMLWYLVFPLARPPLVTVMIFNFVQVWNNFLFPLILTQSPNVRLLPFAIYSFQGQYSMDVPATMAAVLLSAVPLIVAYIIGRRYLLSGLTAGFNR